MNVFLSKFLPLFIYPMGLITLFLLLALFFWKNRNISKIALVVSLILILGAGNKYAAFSIAKSLEWGYPTLQEGFKGDVIVVLGGATEPAGLPRPMVEVNAAADRILYAAKLFKSGAAPTMVLSGGDIDFLDQDSSSPAQDMSTLFELFEIDPSALIIQSQSQNTYEDAVNSCKIIKEKEYQNVILVTSAMHMPRSVELFESQGCKVIPAPTDFTVTQPMWERLLHPNTQEFFINLLPTYSNLSLVTKAMKEYLGMLYYSLTGIL